MLVTLTGAGRDLRHQAEASVRDAQEEILAPLSTEERETLCHLLQRMADANNERSRVPIRTAE